MLYQKIQENIINLKNLDKILINLNEIDYKKKHIELKGFYEEILSKFNQKLEDEQIKSQLERSNLIDDFINLIQTCILFESKLIDNNNFLKNILITDDGNVYRTANVMARMIGYDLNHDEIFLEFDNYEYQSKIPFNKGIVGELAGILKKYLEKELIKYKRKELK